MRLGIQLFVDDTSPLPEITNCDDWYKSSANNGSSVEIFRQMMELSGDLKALPKAKRTTPQVVAEKCSGLWKAKLDDSRSDMIIKYGPEKQHELYLSQAKSPNTRHINLSDTITRIPTTAEADKINGRMKKFTGKGHTTTSIAYGGFKDVPRQVELVIRNVGRKAARVRVEAILHDTYHDNGQEQCAKTLKPGEQGSFTLKAPSLKWIRRLSITSDKGSGDLEIEQFAFEMTPRNKLLLSEASSNAALVFLIAGQSNAGGVAAFSPKSNVKSGMAEKHPTIPGSTAKEMGIPTTSDAYPKSYIWKSGNSGPFERLLPGKNLRGCYNDLNRHGIELPVAQRLEKDYPSADKFFIKHGPAGHNLHTQWAANLGPDYKAFITDYRAAMADLKKRYKNIRVIGLYRDQGESDLKKALEYEKNLRSLFAALRKDTGIQDLHIYVRKHLFLHDNKDFTPVIESQVKITKEDAIGLAFTDHRER